MAPPNLLPFFQFLAKVLKIKIAGPLIIVLLGFQLILDTKFVCPCKYGWSQAVAVLILVVPALITLLIVLLFLMYRKQDITETFEAQETTGRCQVQDNTGSPPNQNNSWTRSIVCACLVPSLMWICIYLIDGDYVACLGTDWNGRYTCEKELHPNCLNWCKPTESSPGHSGTELHEKTSLNIIISKVLGYTLACLLCVIAIAVCLHYLKCCGRKVTTNPTVREGQPEQTELNALTDNKNSESLRENEIKE